MTLFSLPKQVIRERLSDRQALALGQGRDLLGLAQRASEIRDGLHGRSTYYIVNRHIDYSNICAIKCKFCAFARKKGDQDAFELTLSEIVERARQAVSAGATELHIVGGFHPSLPFSHYTEMLTILKRQAPSLHLKVFTAGEIRYFAKKFHRAEEAILTDLIAAGLDSLPGGGAEILAPEIRKEICGPKGPGQDWIDTHRRAHRLGLRSTATMLYGHVETMADRIQHMAMIRGLQDETGGFLCFIPLAFNPKGTAYEDRGFTSGFLDLNLLALARIYFDNIEHIKAYWIMSGVEVAGLAQDFGADDLHGTVVEENITHMAGATTPQALTVPQLEHLIRASGRLPVRRDSLYRTISSFIQSSPAR